MSISTKQKLNMKSSTEAEVMGANDVLPSLIWTTNFLKHQGYDTKSMLYQDNRSAILSESNGAESSGKRTRQLDIQYYFIKDHITKGELEVKFCLTDDMIVDFYMKPLQGAKFRKFQRIIMGEQ